MYACQWKKLVSTTLRERERERERERRERSYVKKSLEIEIDSEKCPKWSLLAKKVPNC